MAKRRAYGLILLALTFMAQPASAKAVVPAPAVAAAPHPVTAAAGVPSAQAPAPQTGQQKTDSKNWIDLLVGIAWPLVAVVAAFFVFRSPGLQQVIRQFSRYISKVGLPGGISLDFSRDEAPRQSAYFGGAFDTLAANAKMQYDQRARGFQIRDYLKIVTEEVLPATLKAVLGKVPATSEQRATVHVPDIVFEHFLYQLVDYYPTPQTGRGRRFSMRYGIIGRAWRLGESVGESDAVDPPPANPSVEQQKKWDEARRVLIEQWGMFPEEAERGSHSRPSYLCIVLKSNTPQGVLFIDSKSTAAFGPAKPGEGEKSVADVAAALEAHETCIKLANLIDNVMQELRLSGPHLKVEEI